MRRFLISSILTATLAVLAALPAANAQSFSSFILSGRADRLAMGDIAFGTPDLAVHQVDVALSFGKWAPQQFNYSALQAGGFLALSERFGVRLDYRNNLFPEFVQIDQNGNEKGTFKPGEQRILAGVSLRLTDNMYIDVNGKYLSADLAGNKASAFAGDIAFSYVKDGMTLGVKAADLGTKYSFGSAASSLPMRVMAGGSYRLSPAEKHAITLGADLGYILPQEYKAFTAAVGAEYAFNQLVFARAGYHFSSAVAPRFASFGLGLNIKGIGLDAAYLLGQASNVWTLSLRVAL